MSDRNWRRVLLGEFITLKRGYDLPKRLRVEGDVPIVSSSGVSGMHNKAKVNGPGVVTGRYGTLGEVFYVTGSYWPLNTTLYVKDFKGSHRKFVRYFLQTLGFENQNAAGAVPGVNRNHLHKMEVCVPPVSTQRKIASILSAYDDLIENNNRRIAILEEMAQTIYREWFVNFRFPGHEITKLVDSPLGLIPQGWDVVRVGEVCEVKHGYAFKSKFFGDDGEFVVLTPGNFHADGGMKYKGAKEKLYTGLPPEDFVLYKGDLLIAMTDLTQNAPILGSPLFIPADRRFLHNQRLGKVLVKRSDLVSPEFLYWFFNSFQFRETIKGSATGSTVRHTAPSRIYEVAFALPPGHLMKRFSEIARTNLELTETLTERSRNLLATRDLLLPKLISGKLDLASLDIDTGIAEGELLEATS